MRVDEHGGRNVNDKLSFSYDTRQDIKTGYLGGSLNETSSFFSNDLLPPINSVMIMLQFARLKTVTLSDALGAELCLASRTRLG